MRVGTTGLSLVVVAAGAAAYGNSLSGPFILDDWLSVVNNPELRTWWRPAGLFFPEQDSPIAGRPLVSASLAVNYALGGLDVRGYHVVNICLHLLAGLVVFGLVRRTLDLRELPPALSRRSLGIGFATSLLWVLHPLNSEVVDYLTQRTESMMALFYLLTLYFCVRALGSPARAKACHTAAITTCLAGMACKESMVTAPLMVMLFDRVFAFSSMRDALRARWPLYAGLAATWLVLASLVWSNPRGDSAGLSSGIGPWMYLLNQAVMIPRYLYLTVWPRPLVTWYGWALPLTLHDVWLEALFAVALLAGTAAALTRNGKVGFLGAWCFITLAPTSSIVPIATEMGAERRMYLPLVGLLALGVVTACSLWDRLRPGRTGWSPVPTLALAALAVLLTVGTLQRNLEYRSGLTIARTMVERWPSAAAHHLFGTELMAAGRHEEARAQLRLAAPNAPRARLDLGRQLFNEGKLDEAVVELQTMLDIWRSPPPIHPWQAPLKIDAVDAHNLIGGAFARMRQWPQAIEHYRAAASILPDQAQTLGLLADALWQSGDYPPAIETYQRYLLLQPKDRNALANLGIAFAVTNRLDEAVATFRRAVDAHPSDADSRRNLAEALLDRGDARGAAEQARVVLALRPGTVDAHHLLGRALMALGEWEPARAQFFRALEVDPASADVRSALARLGRLDKRSAREDRRPAEP